MDAKTEYIREMIYSAMEEDESDKDYLGNVAMMAAFNVTTDQSVEIRKNNIQSEYYREEGNKAYKVGSFQKALVFYNKALLFAPNMSLSLKLAYSNRSAVLFSAKQYRACEKDCDTALAIKCETPSSVIEKLEKRRSQVKQDQLFHNSTLYDQKDEQFRNFADDYFTLKSRSDDIPCASADIDIVFESGIPKVIAKRDIPVGTLVAFEKAFVSWVYREDDENFSCYYCRKLDLNLFPCSGCVVALFCSRQCEQTCMKEYHSVECEIVGNSYHIIPDKRWMIAAIIKLRNMCSSWDELISISYKEYYGNVLKKNEIYDSSKPSSLPSFKKDRHFLHGAVFNNSILCAAILNGLLKSRSFLPQDSEGKLSATKAIARIIMYWGLYCKTTLLNLVTNEVRNNIIHYHMHIHKGMFAFIGKLKHSCLPNLQAVTVNNSMALFALEQIEAGTELTVSHIFEWLGVGCDTSKEHRIMQMYLELNSICGCLVCSNSPDEWSKLTKDKLSATQNQAAFECFSLDHCRIFGIPPKKYLEQLNKALTVLNNVKFSAEYKKVFKKLMTFQMYVLDNRLHNIVLSEDY